MQTVHVNSDLVHHGAGWLLREHGKQSVVFVCPVSRAQCVFQGHGLARSSFNEASPGNKAIEKRALTVRAGVCARNVLFDVISQLIGDILLRSNSDASARLKQGRRVVLEVVAVLVLEVALFRNQLSKRAEGSNFRRQRFERVV